MLRFHTPAFWINIKHIVCGLAGTVQLQWIIHYIITGCQLGAYTVL